MTRALLLAVFALSGACGLIAGLDGERELDVASGASSGGGVAGSAGSAGGSEPFTGHGGSGGTTGRAGDASAGSSGAAPFAGQAGDSGDGGSAGSPDKPAGAAGEAAQAGADTGGSGFGGEAGEGDEPRSLRSATSCGLETRCNGDDPCTALYVRGGEFLAGRGDSGADADDAGTPDEQPEHAVILSPFWLDQYEVSVSRFRAFVSAYTGRGPMAGDGPPPGSALGGWKAEFYAYLPASRRELEELLISNEAECEDNFRTWTIAPGANECLPINCIDWYLSFAFCLWDGGRLPTDAEWEFAAAGGAANRLFPWGSDAPDAEHAVYQCTASGTNTCVPSDIRPVGSAPLGKGLFGHADLAGSMLERTRDVLDVEYYLSPGSRDRDPVNTSLDTQVVSATGRGGGFGSAGGELRVARREPVSRGTRREDVGLRCVRSQ